MKKQSRPRTDLEDDTSRQKALLFKKRKQRGKEPKLNFKNIRSVEDLEDWDDE
tara:strand:+ start:720 stop:878 length:159 start_codon:yes stop_codon:yes gene_type:complete